MITFLQIKELYKQSFKDLENNFAAILMKILAWVCFACIGFVIFVVIYKAATGYKF